MQLYFIYKRVAIANHRFLVQRSYNFFAEIDNDNNNNNNGESNKFLIYLCAAGHAVA